MARQRNRLPDTISERRPSVTNSAWASMRLEQLGLGVDPIAEVLQKALKAELTIYSKFGIPVATKPDYRTQLEAARMLKEIHGFTHVPEQKIDISKTDILIVNEVKNYATQDLVQEESTARELLKRVNRLQEIQD